MEAVNHYSETDLGNVSPNPRGEYDPKEAYEYLDLVSYQGGSYLCLTELGTTIIGTAPEPGHNTEFWQMLTLPGGLTSEYVAMHDNVVNKAAQVEISRAAVEQAQQEVEASQADVQQLHEDTIQAAQEAENSRDSAAGYAQSAEASRKAAAESEQNINAKMTDLDQKVSELVTQAQKDISTARQKAINTITTQEDTSTEAVKQVGNAVLESAGDALQKINTAGQQALQAVTDQQNTSVQAVKDETNSYIEEKRQEISAKTDEVTQAVNQAGEKQLQDIANSLDSTLMEEGKAADAKAVGDALNTKITKFYASNQGETHIVDSDNGKIQDMMIYGKSEQVTTNGYQLFDSAQIGNKTLGGLTSKINEDGSITVTGTSEKQVQFVYKMLLKAGTYTAKRITSGSKTSGSDLTSYIRYYNDDNKYIFPNNTFILDKDREVTIGVYCYDATKDIDQTIWFMLERGSEAHDYEPYTGGVPAPNPDYPQEIRSVVDPIYKVHGRNLVKSYQNNKTDKPYADTLYAEIDEIIPDTQYVLSMIIADGNEAYINEDLVKFTKVTGDGMWKQIVVTTLSNISKNNARLYKKGKGWRILKNDASNTVVSEIKDVQLELGTDATSYEPYHEQAVTLPYTLNAIPVDSGGNVTIDGQQYVADYVDVEQRKLVKYVGVADQDSFKTATWSLGNVILINTSSPNILPNIAKTTIARKYRTSWEAEDDTHYFTQKTGQNLIIVLSKDITTIEEGEAIRNKGFEFFYAYEEPVETDLTPEEIQAFKEFVTYYPVTNVSVTSDQLEGYTVFNYPVSMAEGWNYVKQQLSDNRDYIYNMDAKTQDIDAQSTEAYVNSEYAVAITELEVM